MRRLLASALVMTLCAPSFAGVTDYEFSLTDLVGTEGEVVQTTVNMGFADDADALDGWQVGVCWDTDLMEYVDDSAVSLDVGGSGAAFEGFLEQGEFGFWCVAVIYSFAGDTLPEGGDAYTADYTLGEPGLGTIEICDSGLDADGVAVFVEAEAVAAGENDATVTILNPFTYSLSTTRARYDATTGEGVGSITVTIDENLLGDATGVSGFTVAVSNDSSRCEPTGATESDDLEEVDYFSVTTSDDSVTVEVIVSESDADATIKFDMATAVFSIDYATNPDHAEFDGANDPVITAHEFSDTEDDVNLLTTLVGDAAVVTVPNLEHGAIEWSSSAWFLRCDADGNGEVFPVLDAIFLLRYGWIGGGATPPCLDAADCDGNDVVFPILDALYLLEYGFTNGPLPADPGPHECGPDEDDDGDGPGCETEPDLCA